jgi:hypothetical protein
VRTGARRQAEQLEALLEGRMPAEEADHELRVLASLATKVHEERPGPAVDLTDEARRSMRERLLADIAEVETPATERVAAAARPGMRRAVTSARAALASGLASVMIGTTGVAFAAQEALPGDALYNLKKGTESVRMTLAGDSVQAGRLDLRFAEERLDEVAAGIGRNPDHVLVAGLLEMDQRSMSGAERLVEIAERRGEDELLAEVDQFVDRQSEALADVFGRLPVQVRPYAEDSLGVLRQIRGDLLAPVAAACDCDVATAGEFCDCAADLVREVSSEPLPRPERGDQVDADTRDTERDGSSDGPGGEGTERLRDVTSTDAGTSESRDLVPRLPGALDDVGRTVNDTVGGVVDRTGETVDKVTDETERTVRDTTDKVGDTVDRTTDEVGDTVDETTDKVGDTVDRTTEGVGDLLGSTSDTVDETTDDVGSLLNRD